MNDVWIATRSADDPEYREFHGVYASRTLAKEHIEFHNEESYEWEDDESVSVSEDGEYQVFRSQILNASHLKDDREWRSKLRQT